MSKYETFTDEQLICNLRDGEREIMDYIMEECGAQGSKGNVSSGR